MFMPNSLQADKTSLTGERNNTLLPIISEYLSAREHKCQVEIMRHKTVWNHNATRSSSKKALTGCFYEGNVHQCFETIF